MERLILLHDDAVAQAFKDADAYPFHYSVNTAALIFFVSLGGLIAAVCAALWYLAPLPEPWGEPAAVVVGVAGALLAAWALHWRWVARTSFVAFTEAHMFVGDHKRAWRIDRGLLDAASLGFDRMERKRLLAQLQLRVGGQEIPLLLFHPLVIAKDVETLTASLLAHIQTDEAEPAADAEPAATLEAREARDD